MKKNLLIILFCLSLGPLNAQPFVTVQAGNFTDPATWGGHSPLDTLPFEMVINHAVTLDTSWYHANTVTIGASGSLIEDASPRSFTVSGGATGFTVYGTVRVHNLGWGVTFTNNGVVEADTVWYPFSFYNHGSFTVHGKFYSDYGMNNMPGASVLIEGMFDGGGINYGTITADSMYTRGVDNYGEIDILTELESTYIIYNFPGGSITAGSFINNGPPWWAWWDMGFLVNEGNIFVTGPAESHVGFYNTGTFRSLGTFTNTDSLVINSGSNFTAEGNFTNISDTAIIINNGDFKMGNNFTNKSDVLSNTFFSVDNNFENNGSFTNASTGTFIIKGDFLTKDLAPPGGSFVENGWGYIYGDFTNQSTINGSGRFCVWGVSTNNGSMTGTFDFCDKTGDSLDVNTGTFASTITVCSFPCSIGIQDEEYADPLVIAPNPARETAVVSFGNNISRQILHEGNFCAVDVHGRDVTALMRPSMDATGISLDCSTLPAGVYFVTLTGEKKIFRGKLVVQQ